MSRASTSSLTNRLSSNWEGLRQVYVVLIVLCVQMSCHAVFKKLFFEVKTALALKSDNYLHFGVSPLLCLLFFFRKFLCTYTPFLIEET